MLYVVVTFAIRLYICSVHSCGTSLHRLSSYLEKDFEGMKPIKNVVHISKDEGSVLSVSVEVQRLYVLKRLPIFSHSSRFSHNFSSSDFDVDFHQVDEGLGWVQSTEATLAEPTAAPLAATSSSAGKRGGAATVARLLQSSGHGWDAWIVNTCWAKYLLSLSKNIWINTIINS